MLLLGNVRCLDELATSSQNVIKSLPILERHSLRSGFPEHLILTIQGDFMLDISGSRSDEGFVRQTWLHMCL